MNMMIRRKGVDATHYLKFSMIADKMIEPSTRPKSQKSEK
jgi:hypothetical protein